jgi:hypothetical protein
MARHPPCPLHRPCHLSLTHHFHCVTVLSHSFVDTLFLLLSCMPYMWISLPLSISCLTDLSVPNGLKVSSWLTSQSLSPIWVQLRYTENDKGAIWSQAEQFHFLSSRGSGTGSTQPREDNWGATWRKKERLRSKRTEINGRGNSLRWPHNTLYPQKLPLTSPKSGGLSVVIVRLWTNAKEFRLGKRNQSMNKSASHVLVNESSKYVNNYINMWIKK